MQGSNKGRATRDRAKGGASALLSPTPMRCRRLCGLCCVVRCARSCAVLCCADPQLTYVLELKRYLYTGDTGEADGCLLAVPVASALLAASHSCTRHKAQGPHTERVWLMGCASLASGSSMFRQKANLQIQNRIPHLCLSISSVAVKCFGLETATDNV